MLILFLTFCVNINGPISRPKVPEYLFDIIWYNLIVSSEKPKEPPDPEEDEAEASSVSQIENPITEGERSPTEGKINLRVRYTDSVAKY